MKAAGLSFGAVQKMARAPEDSQLVESVFALPHRRTENRCTACRRIARTTWC